MRPLAFFLTATAFATVFMAIIVASVTVKTTRQAAQPSLSMLAN